MNISIMYSYLQLCRDKNFTVAAKKLHISQQGLSASIARLEDCLDCLLFLRTKDGLQLTKEGEEVKASFEKIIYEYERMITKMHKEGCQEVIRFAVMTEFIGTISSNLRNFLFAVDQVTGVELIERTSRENESLLKNQTVKVATICEPFDKDAFDTIFLFTLNVNYVIHEKNVLSHQDSIEIEDLRDQKLVIMAKRYNLFPLLQQRCRERGFEPKIVYEAGQPSLIGDVIYANPDYIGIFSDYYSNQITLPKLKIMESKNHDIVSNVYLAKLKEKYLTREETHFMNYIAESFRQ